MEPVECYIAKKIIDIFSQISKVTSVEAIRSTFNRAYNLALLAVTAYDIDIGEPQSSIPLPVGFNSVYRSEKERDIARRKLWVIARTLRDLSRMCFRSVG